MAAFAPGIFNRSMTAAQALAGTGATPTSTPSTDPSDTGSSSTNSATISANDFLSLLVTEMQNQDPTATTDPNEYINQLVNVNSLEQLIDINQSLSTALGTSSTQSGSTTATQASPAASTAAIASPAGSTSAGALSSLSAAAKQAPGNLTVPNAVPAAHTVAHALDGRDRAHPLASKAPRAF